MLKHIIIACLVPVVFSCSDSKERFSWEPYGKISAKRIEESSGLVWSRQFRDVLWTHNDSGDRARIFAITPRGELIREVTIVGAENVDWEDMAVDDSGYLYIGDTGNNDNERRDLAVYVIEEPDPYQADSAAVLKRLEFTYPDQKAFPDPDDRNYDCEAIFWTEGSLYSLTKHRSNRNTKLYRFGSLETHEPQTLIKVSEFEIDGFVTSADISDDGQSLVVLCYEYIYLFQKPANSYDYLSGSYKRILFEGRQSEGICLTDEFIYFTNEQREIYRLPATIFDLTSSFLPELPHLSIPKLVDYTLDGLGHEWRNIDGGWLELRLNTLNKKKGKRCENPSARVGRVGDDLLVWIDNWSPPKAKKKKKKVKLLELMVGDGALKTVALVPGAFVWKLSRKKTEYQLKLKFPEHALAGDEPLMKVVESKDVISLELLIPLSTGNNHTQLDFETLLFNLVLNPSSECEWYWSTDTTTYSDENPYLWGELRVSE